MNDGTRMVNFIRQTMDVHLGMLWKLQKSKKRAENSPAIDSYLVV